MLKKGRFRPYIGNKFFPLSVEQPGTGCPEESWLPPSLGVFRVRLGAAWSNLVCWEVSLSCWNWMTLRSHPTQSILLFFNSLALISCSFIKHPFYSLWCLWFQLYHPTTHVTCLVSLEFSVKVFLSVYLIFSLKMCSFPMCNPSSGPAGQEWDATIPESPQAYAGPEHFRVTLP